MRITTGAVGSVLGVALMLGLVGCGDDDAGVAGESVTKLIGPEGGVVALSDGTKVDIPQGALSEITPIKISKLEPERVTLPDNLDAAGKPYKFEPHGTQFSRDVKVTLPFEPEDDDEPLSVRPIKSPDEDGPWMTIVGSEKDDAKKELSFDVQSFSVMRAVRPRRGSGVITLPDGAIVMDGAVMDGAIVMDADLPDVVDAGREPFVPLSCPELTPLRVVFPPSGTATDQPNLTLRVQVQADLNVNDVTIAGVAAVQASDESMWTANVALALGSQELVAIVHDSDGAEVARAATTVTRLPLQLPHVDTAVAGPADILYAFAGGSNELIEINLATAARRVVASSEIGTGAPLWRASRLAYSATRSSALLVDNFNLIEVDLSTGDRALLPRDVVGSEASLVNINGLAISADTALVTGTATTTAGILTGAALLSVELDTGLVTIVSGLGRGTGTALRQTAGLALSADGNTAYVLDVGDPSGQEPARIFAVDVTSGARTLIAEEGDGDGVDFTYPDDLLLGADGDLWIATRTEVVRRAATGARELAFDQALPQSNHYTMRLSFTPSGTHIAVPDQYLDLITLIDIADGTRTTIGREPVGPVRLDAQPDSLAAGGGRLFMNVTFDGQRQLHELCQQNLAHHVLADHGHALIGTRFGYMAFDRDAQEIVVQGDALAAIGIADQATRVVHMAPYARGRSEAHDGIMYVADPEAAWVASYDLSTGLERILGSATIGTGAALNAPTGAVYDGARNRVFVVDYVEGVMALDLTTLARTLFAPIVGGPEALPFPRHMYLRPGANEARIHKDGELEHRVFDLTTDMQSDHVMPSVAVERIGSAGETAFDAELDLLWVAPSGNRAIVHVIDVTTQDAVIVLR